MMGERSVVVLSSLVLAGCVAPNQEEVAPAVLVADEKSLVALRRAIGETLGTSSVTLADDVLTDSSCLLIEPVRPRDAEGRLLQGRELRATEVFWLMKQGRVCVLVHERTGKKFVLDDVRCVPQQAKGQ